MKFVINNVMFCGYFGDKVVFSQGGKCRLFRIYYGCERQLSKELVSVLMNIKCSVDEDGELSFMGRVEEDE